MISGENNYDERDGLSRTASEMPQDESDIDLDPHVEPHPDDLDA